MVVGPPLFVSFGFFLSLIAVESLALLSSARVSSATISPKRLRTFKGENAPATLRLGSVRSKLVGSRRFAIMTPYGLECAVGEFREGSSELTLEPSRAGRFEDLSLKLIDRDILGLFERESLVYLEGFVLESLPSSLRAPARPILVSPISLGDVPAGRRGGGQELHAVEEYHPGFDAKDVIWRRVAQSPTEELVSRSRESSIRRTASLCLALKWKSEASKAILIDLTAEALGQIGKVLLELGTTVRISFVSRARPYSIEASSLGELADAILATAETDDGGISLQESMPASDVLVAETLNYIEEGGGAFSRTGPVLLISETRGTRASRDRIFVFTGSEDLTALVELVIET